MGGGHGAHWQVAPRMRCWCLGRRPTLEVIVTETPAHLQRREDPETGLALIDLEASDTVDRSFSLPLDDPL